MNQNGKRPRRRYDDKFRASAVVMLEAAGYPGKEGALMEVARHLGMPHNTLRNWYHAERNPPPSELRQHIKKSLVEMLDDIAYKLVGAMPSKIIDASLQQTATSLAIVIDKYQLLTGQPTWRIELKNLLKEGTLTPQDILNEFADEPEAAVGLLESFGLSATEIREAEMESEAALNPEGSR